MLLFSRSVSTRPLNRVRRVIISSSSSSPKMKSSVLLWTWASEYAGLSLSVWGSLLLALLTGAVSVLSRDEVEKRYEGKLSKNMSGTLYEIVSRVMKALVNRKITVPGNFQG